MPMPSAYWISAVRLPFACFEHCCNCSFIQVPIFISKASELRLFHGIPFIIGHNGEPPGICNIIYSDIICDTVDQ